MMNVKNDLYNWFWPFPRFLLFLHPPTRCNLSTTFVHHPIQTAASGTIFQRINSMIWSSTRGHHLCIALRQAAIGQCYLLVVFTVVHPWTIVAVTFSTRTFDIAGSNVSIRGGSIWSGDTLAIVRCGDTVAWWNWWSCTSSRRYGGSCTSCWF